MFVGFLHFNMEQSATLDIETLKITQEQFLLASQSLHLQRSSCSAYPGGSYGWRKRCLYFFLLLLVVTMIVNLALTVWIIKVMNFSVDGMGTLMLNEDGIQLRGISEFLFPLYVNDVQSQWDGLLALRSDKNVTLNARNDQDQVTSQLTVGPEGVDAMCKRLEVRSSDGEKLLFTADEEGLVITTERVTVTGSDGAVFERSVETPLIHARMLEDLRLESPTRSLSMEAPKGVEVSAANGFLKVFSQKDLQLESTEGEIFLNAATIQLAKLPLGDYRPSSSAASQDPLIYELCVCPSGKVYLAPAQSSSTCQAMSSICLWS
ncbi:zeta-sarcoglycan-like [Synchiropus splendidus]|uniref:zeta-sarcoglycan-like n=1 Tax=Synchiropus splendidus TaxID=270530 RepID=UPI00237E5DA4|nr:zeta-sarcoglycan-like [Synchiropus splendidus]